MGSAAEYGEITGKSRGRRRTDQRLAGSCVVSQEFNTVSSKIRGAIHIDCCLIDQRGLLKLDCVAAVTHRQHSEKATPYNLVVITVQLYQGLYEF